MVVKEISNKYGFRFVTIGIHSFIRFNRNRELIPNCCRSHRESTFIIFSLVLRTKSNLETDDLRVSPQSLYDKITLAPRLLFTV